MPCRYSAGTGVELGGRQGADRAGGLPGRRASAIAGCPPAPHGEAAALLPGFLFRRALARFESDRFSSGASWPSGFVYLPSVGLGRVRGCGHLRAWPADLARGGPPRASCLGRARDCCAWRSPREPTPATSTGRTSAVSGPAPWTFVRKAPRRTTIWATRLEHVPGRLPEAIAEYQAALRIDPELCRGAQQPGTGAGRHTWPALPEAIAEYQAALRIEPDRAEAHNNLANRTGAHTRPAAGGDCRIPGGAADSTR